MLEIRLVFIQVSDKRKPEYVHVGDILVVESRRKKPWLALIVGPDPIYGVEREFLFGWERHLNFKVTWYYFRIDERGRYEVDGYEFRPFRYSFEVRT